MSSGVLIVEPLPQLSELEQRASSMDSAVAKEYTPSRRREFLAWRAIVRRVLGKDVELGYNSVGAPIVNRKGCHIGVSHSADAVAVVISDKPCAVDIEPVGRDVSKVIRRVAGQEELLLSTNDLLPLALWCAKECLYKLAGASSIDFRRDILIDTVDFDGGTMSGRVCGADSVALRMEIHHGNMVVTNVVDCGKIG